MKISKEEFIILHDSVFTSKVIEELNSKSEENEYLEYLYALIQERDMDKLPPRVNKLISELEKMSSENQHLKRELSKTAIIENTEESFSFRKTINFIGLGLLAFWNIYYLLNELL